MEDEPAQQINENEDKCQQKGIELEQGDQVLLNDRKRALEVVDRHKRKRARISWQHRHEDDHHTVIELKGNGTKYHLLCTGGSKIGPMLYKEADWDKDKSNKLGQKPKYSRSGERVKSMEVLR